MISRKIWAVRFSGHFRHYWSSVAQISDQVLRLEIARLIELTAEIVIQHKEIATANGKFYVSTVNGNDFVVLLAQRVELSTKDGLTRLCSLSLR